MKSLKALKAPSQHSFIITQDAERSGFNVSSCWRFKQRSLGVESRVRIIRWWRTRISHQCYRVTPHPAPSCLRVISNLNLLFDIMHVSKCVCCSPLWQRNPCVLRPWRCASRPNSEPTARRTESRSAASGVRDTCRLHHLCVWMTSAPGAGRAWGGREHWRTPRRRRGGWSCTGPTGGSGTSESQQKLDQRHRSRIKEDVIESRAVFTWVRLLFAQGLRLSGTE